MNAPKGLRGRVYDPLRAGLPHEPLDYPHTYWQATAGTPPADDGTLSSDVDAEVAIIGGGYTGLSCAYTLAQRFGIRALVLEAHRPAWGCSGRNGSFARIALGRLPYAQWIERWGLEEARAMFAEARSALDTVRELISEGDIDCDRQPEGVLKIAHREGRVRGLEAERRLLSDAFGYRSEFLHAAALRESYFHGDEACGALRLPDGFGLHPMKFAFGILRMAREAGAVVHGASPVTCWRREGGQHLLETPRARVRARRVVIATNGYSTERLHPALKGRLIPVLSNIIVTRPMTDAQQQASRLVTTDLLLDTRQILNYYRRLPDGRMLLGSRGPIHESQGNLRRDKLLEALCKKFPALRGIGVDYCWGGWVALTMDRIPHIHQVQDDPTVSYAIGYNGSGVSAAVHAGRRLALQLGGGAPVLAALRTPVPRVPFAAFRRLGQRLAFAWFRLADRN